MGKRSRRKFRRIERDAYNTPAEAVWELLKELGPATKFVEPCAGAGYLVGHLKRAGHICVGAYDLPTDARVATSRRARSLSPIRRFAACAATCTRLSRISLIRHRRGS
jgi:hypothetical protein